MNSTKNKYLKSLGFFNKISVPQMGIIPESLNENIYDEENEPKTGNYKKSVSGEKLIEQIILAVKNNSLAQIQELLTNHSNDIDINSLGIQGWNALHSACFLGMDEIVKEIVHTFKADVTIKNKDGWYPLHLACYKGHLNSIKITK